MELTFHGKSCVRLKGKEVVVLVEPPRGGDAKGLKADLIVSTTGDSDPVRLRPTAGEVQCVQGPGEYEVKGVTIYGIPTATQTVMCIEVDGIRVVACGNAEAAMGDDDVDRLGHVDVLVVGVSNEDGSPAPKVSRIVNAIEPSYVVPVGFFVNEGDNLAPIDAVLRDLGVPEGWTPQSKISLASSAPGDEVKTVILEARPLT